MADLNAMGVVPRQDDNRVVAGQRPALAKAKKRDDDMKEKESKAGGPRFGKLIQNDGKSIIYRTINRGYTFYMIISTFTKKLIWFGTCAAFMWGMPIMYELFQEQ